MLPIIKLQVKRRNPCSRLDDGALLVNQTVDDGLNLIKPSLVKSQVAVLQCFVWQGWEGPCATGTCVGCSVTMPFSL